VREASFTNTVVYQSDLVTIGAWRCDREYPKFSDTGPVRQDCFVFPRTAVTIEHEDAPAFVANPNIVTFYNDSERYVRREISAEGDRCDWYAVRRDLAREAVRAVRTDVDDAPFAWHRGRCDARTYLLQRRLFNGVVSGAIADSMAVDEAVLALLDGVIGARECPSHEAKRRGVIHDVERMLSARFDEDLDLPQIAAHVGVSVYHLCRTFREGTGLALHQYLRQLRIRHGLEKVCETASPLSRIAVDLGFAHHSHFTSAFRRDFAVTPSELRRARRRY
jgi:AraC-like DNA-binding protein